MKPAPSLPPLIIADVVMAHPYEPRAWLAAVHAKAAEMQRERAEVVAELANPASTRHAEAREVLDGIDRDLRVVLPELVTFLEIVLEARARVWPRNDGDPPGLPRGVSIAQVVKEHPDNPARWLTAVRGAMERDDAIRQAASEAAKDPALREAAEADLRTVEAKLSQGRCLASFLELVVEVQAPPDRGSLAERILRDPTDTAMHLRSARGTIAEIERARREGRMPKDVAKKETADLLCVVEYLAAVESAKALHRTSVSGVPAAPGGDA